MRCICTAGRASKDERLSEVPPFEGRASHGHLRGTRKLWRGVLPAAAADHGANGVVGAEIFGAIDIEQRAEFRSRAVDAALDGADRAAADRRGIFIGEAGGANQDQRLALVLWELVERGAEFLELQMRVLRG